MQKVLALTLALVFTAACGKSAADDSKSNANNGNGTNGSIKAPSTAQAAQLSALFAGQMTNSASSQGSSRQTSRLAVRDASMDPNCTGNDPQAAANDPNCTAGPGGFPGAGASNSQTITLPAVSVPCEAGGSVAQSGNMTFSETVGTGGGFAMSGSMAIEAVYHSCAMPAPDGNSYTMNAPSGVAQDMNMNMTFPAIDANTLGAPSTPIFPQMTLTSTVVGDNITVYAANGNVVAQGSVDLSMSIALDANGTGTVHFSGTQFGLAVDANQTFTPPSQAAN